MQQNTPRITNKPGIAKPSPFPRKIHNKIFFTNEPRIPKKISSFHILQLNSIHYNQVQITVLIPTQHQLMISQRIQSSYLSIWLLTCRGKLTNGLFLLVILQEIMTMYVVQLVTPSDKYIVP